MSYRAPKINDLMDQVKHGVSILCLTYNIKLFSTPYYKSKTLAVSYYKENKVRAIHYCKTNNEREAKKEFENFIEMYIKELCISQGISLEKSMSLLKIANKHRDHQKSLMHPKGTLKAYEGSMSQFIRTVGDVDISSISLEIAQDFINNGKFDPKSQCRIKWETSATIRKHIRHLKAIWHYAIKHQNLSIPNVWKEVDLPRASKISKPTPTLEEVNLICNSINKGTAASIRNARFCMALLLTGLRISSELLRLKRNCLNGNFLTVTNSNNQRTKTSEPRTFGICEEAVNLLKDQILENEKNGIISDYIFPEKNGLPISYSTFRDSWNKSIRLLKLEEKGYTFHSLRRLFGQLLFDAGTPIQLIQKFYGHSTIRTTEEYISRSSSSKIDLECMNKLGKEIVKSIDNIFEHHLDKEICKEPQ
jgi:integrase